MRLVVATRNAGKLREISRLLSDAPYEVVGLSDLSNIPEVVEDGDSFAANAEKKARTVAELTGELTLADDSGLSVAALDGAPGIFSARYAGPQADDAANNARLIAELRQVPDGQRQAAFVCAMALCWPQGECRIFHGRIEGEILHAPRGAGGFGYDPLFYVPTRQGTMAELPLDVKNRISHRGQALGQVIRFLHSDDCPG